MFRSRIVAVVALSGLIAMLCIQCGKPEAGKTATDPAGALKPGDDFKATMDAYIKADDDETKTRLWLDFLKRNPNNSYTVGTINYVVDRYYLEEKKDPEGAVRFAVEHLSRITDDKLKKRADSALLRLYGKVGNKAELRQLADQIGERRGLGLGEHLVVARAAVDAKDWDLARSHCQTLLEQNTPEKLRSDPAFEKSSAEKVRETLDENRGQAILILGQAALESNDSGTALARFAEAGKLARYTFAGLHPWPFEDLNVLWAKALLKSGDPSGALRKISVDAMVGEGKEALSVLADAHRAAGIEGDLQQYIQRVEPTIAKSMPAFSAYDYKKNKVSYDQLKGSVTLLAFWFPT